MLLVHLIGVLDRPAANALWPLTERIGSKCRDRDGRKGKIEGSKKINDYKKRVG